jgi:hypothetical protein
VVLYLQQASARCLFLLAQLFIKKDLEGPENEDGSDDFLTDQDDEKPRPPGEKDTGDRKEAVDFRGIHKRRKVSRGAT